VLWPDFATVLFWHTFEGSYTLVVVYCTVLYEFCRCMDMVPACPAECYKNWYVETDNRKASRAILYVLHVLHTCVWGGGA
jgi:hypothetical protein